MGCLAQEIWRQEVPDGHIVVFGVIEQVFTQEEQKVQDVVEQALPVDEADKFGKQIAIHISKVLPPVQPPKIFIATIQFYITKEQFSSMGRPAVGDYIQVDSSKRY